MERFLCFYFTKYIIVDNGFSSEGSLEHEVFRFEV